MARPEIFGIFEDVIRDLQGNHQNTGICVAERVILVDGGNPPTFVLELLADTLPPEFGLCIVKVPPIDVPFKLQRLMIEGVQLLDSAKLTCSRLDEVQRFAGGVVVGEVEGYKREVPTSYPDRGSLSRGEGDRPEHTVRDHGERNPFLTSLGRRAGILRGRLNWRAEDEVEVGQPEGSIGRLAPVNGLNAFNYLMNI
jgi:hypothetical protein